MNNSLHHLLMADHLMLQKTMLDAIRDTGLTSGQPKVLDYLIHHDGVIQKELAAACHIEPASLTTILNGMESKGLIERQMKNHNRRSYYVYMTDKGRTYAERLGEEFTQVEELALAGFDENETELLIRLLTKLYVNLKGGQEVEK